MAKFKKTLAAFAMPVVALIAAAVTCFFVPLTSSILIISIFVPLRVCSARSRLCALLKI
ncbi:MAG: hypothetical protein ACLU1U_02795 [Lachnospiraceae bacterium]